jgi:hypothetical protein
MTVNASSLRRLDERLLALFSNGRKNHHREQQERRDEESCADRPRDEYGRIAVPDRFECS